MRRFSSILGCLLVAPTAAGAAETGNASPELYAIAWVRGEGAEDCPRAIELQQEVEQRVGRHLFDPVAARSIEVSVQRDQTTVPPTRRSEIHVRDAQGKTLGHRTLQSSEADCRSLFSSTALAIALVVDPESATARNPTATAAPPQKRGPEIGVVAPPSSMVASSVAKAPNLAISSNASPTAVTPAPILGPPAPSPQTCDATTNQQNIQLVASALMSTRVVPSTQPGVMVSMHIAPTASLGWSLGALYVHHGESSTTDQSSVAVSLTRFDASADLQLLSAEPVRVLASLGPSLGAMHIAVRGTPAVGPTERLVAAIHAGASIQLKLHENALVELGLQGVMPLNRAELTIADRSAVLWKQPAFGGIGRIGIGIPFP